MTRPAMPQEFWDQPRVFPNAVWVWIRPDHKLDEDAAFTLYLWLERKHKREGVPIKPFSAFKVIYHAAPSSIVGDPYSQVATFGIKAE